MMILSRRCLSCGIARCLRFIIVLAVLTLLIPMMAQAGDDDEHSKEYDRLFDSFEATENLSAEESGIREGGGEDNGEPAKPSMHGFGGYLKFGVTSNIAHKAPGPEETDWRGLSGMKPEIHLEYNGQKDTVKWHIGGKASYDGAYKIKGREGYSDEVIEHYEFDHRFEKIYVSGMLTDNVGMTLGRQIVVWGKSDNIRVTDVINPLNVREYGYADMEDIRLPIAMVRFDLSSERLNLSAMVIPEIRFNDSFPFGSDYYPYNAPPPDEDVPADRLSNAEYAVAVNGYFTGWDLSVYYADIYNDAAHLERDPLTSKPFLKHARLTMLGSSVNAARGDWVFKCEGAYFSGLRYFNVPGHLFSRVDVLAGFDYSGISDTTVTFETANRHMLRFRNGLDASPDDAKKDLMESILRIHRSWLNDTLALTALTAWFGGKAENGSYVRLNGEYDLSDDLELSLGVICYQSGELPLFKRIGRNDRLYGQIKYSF